MLLFARISLAQKIAAASLLGLAMLAGILFVVYHDALGAYADRLAQQNLKAAEAVAWDALKREGTEFRVEDGKLLAGARPLNGAFEIVDRVQSLVGGVATIFMGDTRVATNVKKPDGSRAVGTKLAPGPAYDAVFHRHEAYHGTADILGASYFTVYDPILSPSGEVIGILFVGRLKSETHAEIAEIQNRALVAGLAAVSAIALALLWLSRRIFAPLGALRAATQRVARGELGSQVTGLTRRDDIGDMARALDDLRRTAQDKAALDRESASQREEREAERRERERDLARRNEEQGQFLAKLGAALQRLAGGDLAAALDDRAPPAYRQLVADFNAAVGSLGSTLAEVRRGVGAVAGAAEEVASASRTLSQRSEHDAQSLEETVQALRRLTQTVTHASDVATSARGLAAQAGKAAEGGGEIARRAGEAMQGIEGSSREIREILSLINEIAFQTNLLALNAGVEAARAGEAGKGFAVVASEVRALAQRSAEAARQIATLVAASDAQVAAGVARVGETREALTQIIARVSEVAGLIGEIAQGAGEQASGLLSLSAAVSELGNSVQENAAMAEQTNASGGALTEESEALSRSIGLFRLREDGALAYAA